jgi:hypothetical protein
MNCISGVRHVRRDNSGGAHESFGERPCRGAVAAIALRGGDDMGGVLVGGGSAAITAASRKMDIRRRSSIYLPFILIKSHCC